MYSNHDGCIQSDTVGDHHGERLWSECPVQVAEQIDRNIQHRGKVSGTVLEISYGASGYTETRCLGRDPGVLKPPVSEHQGRSVHVGGTRARKRVDEWGLDDEGLEPVEFKVADPRIPPDLLVAARGGYVINALGNLSAEIGKPCGPRQFCRDRRVEGVRHRTSGRTWSAGCGAPDLLGGSGRAGITLSP